MCIKCILSGDLRTTVGLGRVSVIQTFIIPFIRIIKHHIRICKVIYIVTVRFYRLLMNIMYTEKRAIAVNMRLDNFELRLVMQYAHF